MRKKLISITLLFLFINILSMAVENPTTLSDGLSLVDPAYQEALKDYKPNLENVDKIFNYIEKNMKEKGRAVFYSKLEKEKNQIIVTDENNNVIFAEKIPEKLTEMIPYYECKEIYQLKNGKTLNYSEMNTEMLEKKVKIKSETLMKIKLNKKDAIKSLNLINNLNNLPNDIYSDIEYLKFEVYDENNNLLQKMNYKNNKMTLEQEVEGEQVKMIYLFDNSNSMSGKLEVSKNGELVSIIQIKNLLPEGEVKMFYPSGKLLSTFYIKNNKMDGSVKTYYENGKIQGVYNIKDNVLNGESIEYDENGNVIKKVLYKNGNIVK